MRCEHDPDSIHQPPNVRSGKCRSGSKLGAHLGRRVGLCQHGQPTFHLCNREPEQFLAPEAARLLDALGQRLHGLHRPREQVRVIRLRQEEEVRLPSSSLFPSRDEPVQVWLARVGGSGSGSGFGRQGRREEERFEQPPDEGVVAADERFRDEILDGDAVSFGGTLGGEEERVGSEEVLRRGEEVVGLHTRRLRVSRDILLVGVEAFKESHRTHPGRVNPDLGNLERLDQELDFLPRSERFVSRRYSAWSCFVLVPFFCRTFKLFDMTSQQLANRLDAPVGEQRAVG